MEAAAAEKAKAAVELWGFEEDEEESEEDEELAAEQIMEEFDD